MQQETSILDEYEEMISKSAALFLDSYFNRLQNQVDLRTEELLIMKQSADSRTRIIELTDFEINKRRDIMLLEIDRHKRRCFSNQIKSPDADVLENHLLEFKQHILKCRAYTHRICTNTYLDNYRYELLKHNEFFFLESDLNGYGVLVSLETSQMSQRLVAFIWDTLNMSNDRLYNFMKNNFYSSVEHYKTYFQSCSNENESKNENFDLIWNLMLGLRNLKNQLEDMCTNNDLSKSTAVLHIDLNDNYRPFKFIKQIEVAHVDNQESRFVNLKKNFFIRLAFLEKLTFIQCLTETIDDFAFVECTQLTHFNLTKCKLSRISINMFSALESLLLLNLSANHLIEIEPKSFRSMTSLNELRLSYNRLSMIEKKTFSGLYSLKDLVLSTNRIAFIEEGSFDCCSQLETLYLKSNRLGYLSANVFRSLRRLTYLDLSKNMINELSDDTFNDLVSLQFLDLSENSLCRINRRVFSHLTSLHTLYLSHNTIDEIEDFSFNNLSVLQELDLSFHKVIKLSSNTFKGLDSLRSLLLNSKHKIEQIDSQAFQMLKNLSSRLVLTGYTTIKMNELLPRHLAINYSD